MNRLNHDITVWLRHHHYIIIVYSHMLLLGQSNSSDGYIWENVKAVSRLITRATFDPISPNIEGGLPISPPLSGVVSQYWDPVEFDHGVGRLVVELKEQHLASVETNKELVAIELNTGDLYLIIVTARVPETNLRRGRERERERERIPCFLKKLSTHYSKKMLKSAYMLDFVLLGPAPWLLLFLIVIIVRTISREEVWV